MHRQGDAPPKPLIGKPLFVCFCLGHNQGHTLLLTDGGPDRKIRRERIGMETVDILLL